MTEGRKINLGPLVILLLGLSVDGVVIWFIVNRSQFRQYERTREICDAASAGNVSALREMLAEDGSLAAASDVDGMTPLHWAAIKGHVEIIDLLHAHGADLNAVDDPDGKTPLIYAVRNGRIEAVRLLLRLGSNRDIRDHKGQSAFDVAKSLNYKDIEEVLAK
jgi:ankyrin repeat protein